MSSAMQNFYNRMTAWRAWQVLAERALYAGRSDLIEKHRPSGMANWRTIDKHTEMLRAELFSGQKLMFRLDEYGRKIRLLPEPGDKGGE